MTRTNGSPHPLWYRLEDSRTGGSVEALTRQLQTFIGHLIDVRDKENNIMQFSEALPIAHPARSTLIFGCSLSIAQGLMEDGFPTGTVLNTQSLRTPTFHLSRYRICSPSASDSTIDFFPDRTTRCPHLSRRLGQCEYGSKFCDLWLDSSGAKCFSGSAHLQNFSAVSNYIPRLVGDGSLPCNQEILINSLLLSMNKF